MKPLKFLLNSHKSPMEYSLNPMFRLKGTTFTDLLCDSDGHCPEFQLDLDTTTAATARAFQTPLGWWDLVKLATVGHGDGGAPPSYRTMENHNE